MFLVIQRITPHRSEPVLAVQGMYDVRMDLHHLPPGEYAIYEPKGNTTDDDLPPRFELTERLKVGEAETPPPPQVKTIEALG